MYTVKNKRVFPSPPEVDWFIPYANNVGWVYDSVGVPSSREGNRLIYSSDDEHLEYVAECYRPLSRYIGLYHYHLQSVATAYRFPSPLEVDRVISKYCGVVDEKEINVSVPYRGE